MGRLKLLVVSAAGLKKADTFGKSDPFCKVLSNDDAVGKTEVIKKTLDPEWNAEFEITLKESEDGDTEIENSNIRFEIFDKDLIGSDDFLGKYEMKNDAILDFLKLPTDTNKTFDLLEKNNSKGKGSITVKFISYTKDEESYLTMKDKKNMVIIRLIRAKDLKKADMFGKSDAYAALYFNDTMHGKTEIIKKNLNPIWETNFEIPIADGNIANLGSGEMKTIVYDYDKVGDHDFLGQLKLQGLELLEFLLTRTPKIYNLRPEDDKIGKDKSISGTVTMQCLGVMNEDGQDASEIPEIVNQMRENAKKKTKQPTGANEDQIIEKKKTTYLSDWSQWERLYDVDTHNFFYYNNFNSKIKWKQPFDFGLDYRVEERLWAPPAPYVRSQSAQKIQRMVRIFIAKRKIRRKRGKKLQIAPKQVWVEAFDPQVRRKYFHNTETNAVIWKRPMEMRTDMNRWIKAYDPFKKKVYYYKPIVGEVKYEMPDNYTPGGSNKQFSAAIKIQAAFRAFQSRCNRHNDKFLVRKFPITMPLIFNPEENLEENEMYNAFQSAVRDFSEMYRHRYTRKSARARSMIFDLKFLLEDIKVKYRNLEKNTGNNVNDEEVDEVKNVITMFTDQVENAIPIVINEEMDMFRIIRNRLRDLINLDIYKLQTPGLDDTDESLLGVRTEVDKAKHAVLSFQSMGETKYALTKLRKRRKFQGNYAVFAKTLRQVIKKVYQAVYVTNSFMQVSGELMDKRISQVELLRMRQEEAKQRSYIFLTKIRAEKKAKHEAFVLMCQDKWVIGKEKKVIEQENKIKMSVEEKNKLKEKLKEATIKRNNAIIKKARDIASPWKAIRLDITPTIFRELLQGEMERQLYQEKKQFTINDKCPETGETMPGNAVLFGKINILQYLLQMRANPDLIDNKINKTALLHIAASVDRPDMIAMLLDHGATMCIKDAHGDTALHIAVRAGYRRTVRQFLKYTDMSDFYHLLATPNHKAKLAIDLVKKNNAEIKTMLKPYQAKALSVAVLDDNEHRLLAKRAIQLKAKSNFNILNPATSSSRKKNSGKLPKLDGSGSLKKKKKKLEAPELMESEILRRKMKLVKKKYGTR